MQSLNHLVQKDGVTVVSVIHQVRIAVTLSLDSTLVPLIQSMCIANFPHLFFITLASQVYLRFI